MVAMAMTMMDTDCAWSFLAVAEVPGAVLEGLAEHPEADTDLHPGAQNTGSSCQVSKPSRGLPSHISTFLVRVGITNTNLHHIIIITIYLEVTVAQDWTAAFSSF